MTGLVMNGCFGTGCAGWEVWEAWEVWGGGIPAAGALRLRAGVSSIPASGFWIVAYLSIGL